MLEPRADAPPRAPLPEALRGIVRDKLSALPLSVLETVAANDTRVAVVRRGESLADLGIFREVDVDRTYVDPVALASIARGAFAAADLSYGAQIAAAQADPSAVARLADLKVIRSNSAWRSIWAETKGLLDRPFANCGLMEPAYSALGQSPVTLRNLADLHGARTPEEQRRYADLMLALNPGLERLMAATSPDVSVYDRAFVVADQDVVAPSYHLFRRTGDPAERPRVFNGHDHGSLVNWQANRTRAQYWFTPERRTLVLHEQYLDTNVEGIDTVVHEFGHAYEDALQHQDPGFYSVFRSQWREAYDRHSAGQGQFPTQYSRYSPQEYFADEFAIRFDPRHADKLALDPEAARLMQGAVDRAADLHPPHSPP